MGLFSFLFDRSEKSRRDVPIAKSQYILSDASSPKSSPIRDLLFGDTPLDELAGSASGSPALPFAEAKLHLDAGRRDDAAAYLRELLTSPDLGTRYRLQAWHFLSSLGHKPDPEDASKGGSIAI